MISIGYVGEEAFDVILYASRILDQLNYEVLIADFSDSNSLFRSVYHGMELDSRKHIVNYRGINYIRRMPLKEELEAFREGVVFSVYGYHNPKAFFIPCNETIAVINTFPHVIDKINALLNDSKESLISRVLIRDIIDMNDIDRVKNAIAFPMAKESFDFLYLDYGDYGRAINCQVTQMIRLTDISMGLMKYLINLILFLVPDISPKIIKNAIRAVRRG